MKAFLYWSHCQQVFGHLVGRGKSFTQSQPRHPCLCLRLQKVMSLSHVSWAGRLVAFQLISAECHLCVTDTSHPPWKIPVSEISLGGGYSKSDTSNSKWSCCIYNSCKKNSWVFVTRCSPHLAMASISTCQWTLLFLGCCFPGLMWAAACDLATDLGEQMISVLMGIKFIYLL